MFPLKSDENERSMVDRIWKQLFDDLKNRISYWELKEEAEDKKKSLSHEYKEVIQLIFHKFKDLLTSIINNNNNNNNIKNSKGGV